MVPITFSSRNESQGPVAGLRYFNIPGQNGEITRVMLYDAGPSLSLTYTSFGFALLPVASGTTPAMHATLVGIPTATLPATGSASYTGIVAGLAAGNSITYVLTGTSSLSADFAAGNYSTRFSFTGTDIAGSGATLATQNFSGNNTFTFNGSPLNGSLTGSGSWQGSFFGPNAEEFGYTFNVSGPGYTARGVAVGKKD